MTLFIWDGDTLAFEQRGRDGKGRTTHYVFEPGTFVPVAQGVMNHIEEMLHQPSYGFPYDIDRDLVWQEKPTPKPFDTVGWYQCDHLGTPMEVTSVEGHVAWHGIYSAFGSGSTYNINTNSLPANNNLRFQGQYSDLETNLHYNRHRFYSPQTGRFCEKDPIGLLGGLNLYLYAANPISWVDPLGLKPCPEDCNKILSEAGVDIDTHANLSTDAKHKGSLYESHHIYQQAALLDNKTKQPLINGYTSGNAIAIRLVGKNPDRSRTGTPHYKATLSQNSASSAGLLGSETVVAFNALRAAGLSAPVAKCATLKARGQLSHLGAHAGTPTLTPRSRRK